MKRIIILHGKAHQVFRTFAKLVIADRILETMYGKRIELTEANDYSKRMN